MLSGRAVAPGELDAASCRLNAANAAPHGVVADVHPLDFIYRFCIENPCFATRELAVKYYFQTGADSAGKFRGVLRELYPGRTQPLDVLEFAAGYGCVTRHLARGGVPLLNLTSCDIHPQALTFLGEQIGVPVIASEQVPEKFHPGRQFDVVFALSFFSHMPRSTFGRWLRALFRTVRAPGYLAFTTQGLEGARHIGCMEIPKDGYWFAPSSEQKDLDTAEYGSTLALPQFVIGEIYAQLAAPIAMYRYAHWWDTQDLWVVSKGAAESVPGERIPGAGPP